jgi:hypothetical protein
MDDTKRTCVFCGGTPLTREHHPPQWINKYFDQPHATDWIVACRGDAEESWGTSRTLSPNSPRLVCEPCNTGWMSRIEGVTEPILGPMTQGVGRVLDQETQLAVATWLVKSALVVARQGAQVHATMYREAFDQFYRDARPSDAYEIYVGATNDLNLSLLTFRPVAVNNQTAQISASSHAFAHVVAIGHFLGAVVYRDPRVVTKPANPKFVRRIWPVSTSFIWPSGPFLPLEAVQVLAEGPFGLPFAKWASKLQTLTAAT